MIVVCVPRNGCIGSKLIAKPSRMSAGRPRWLDFFDPDAALRAVVNHIETLPGSRYERHTMRAYLSSLSDFCGFLGATVTRWGDEHYQFNWNLMEMPTRAGCGEYIAACKRKGLSSATITRYMAAARHFVRALEEQPVYTETGNDFVFILEAQRQLRLAASTKNPAADRTSNRPALEQYGTRLSLAQVNRVLESFSPEMGTITGQRDLALLYLGITSGLRAAELARLTLNSIQGIPPEMLRAGRFDRIFYTDLPSPAERRKIMEIHLKRRKTAPESLNFSDADWAAIVEKTDKYVGAELEQVICSARYKSFASRAVGTPTLDEMLEAANSVIPMARRNADQINAILDFCKDTAEPVSSGNEVSQVAAPIQQRSRGLQTQRTRQIPGNN